MRSRRNTEALLLAVAILPVLLIFVLLQTSLTRQFDPGDLLIPAALAGAFAAAHLAVRKLAPAADPVLLPLTALLCGLGLAFVTRLAPELATLQLYWLLIGVAALVVTLVAIPSLERLARYKYTIGLAGLALLISPALFGVEINGARLWLRFAGMSFQPGEVAKILLVLFLAAYLAENREVLSVSTRRVIGIWLPPARQLGPLLVMWAVSLFVLVMSRDLGSSLLYFGIFLVAIYAATGRIAYVLTGMGLFVVGATVAYSIFGHVRSRVAIWIDPFSDTFGRGFQLVQSLFSLADGGILGLGPGNGFSELIPFAETDFIFTAIAEELGLVGGVAFILAYLVFCMRGLSTAARARSDFSALVAAGLTGAFALQVFVIIGGVTRLIPLTGITLPFVSYGGSSILANFILLALLLRAGDAGTGAEAELRLSSSNGTLGRMALAHRLTRLASLFAILLTIVVINLTWIQAVTADALANHPANTRRLLIEERSPRGSILTSDGILLAESVPSADGRYLRQYPLGAFAAHVIGYHDATYGRSGIEAAANQTLVGRRDLRTFRDAIDVAAGIPVRGNDIGLTLHSDVQRVAEEALRGRNGAVVAIDPETGAILAMASSPGFDPGRIGELWQEYSSDAQSPLLNRATQSLYPPGSTFKVVPLCAALEKNVATPSTRYSAPGRLEIGGAPVTNFGGASYGTVDLRRATAASINTVFGQLTVDLGAEALVEQSARFGFNSRPPLEIPVATSVMPDPARMTLWETAWAGIGQPVGEHDAPGPQSTVLQMALVTSGIANDGVVMRPHLIARVTDQAGRIISRNRPEGWLEACKPDTAQTVTDLMVTAVTAGTGRTASIPGVSVAGKTGTAEVGGERTPHSWFIGFAPADNPTVAIAVVLENAGPGGRHAAPAARNVLQTALTR